MRSLHVVGSKAVGGAERFYLRLIEALHAAGSDVAALARRGSEMEAALPPGVPARAVPMRTVWDPLSRFHVQRAIRLLKPDIVQTYMGRATRLTHLKNGPVHVARLGGYYKLAGYRHAHAWIGNTKGVCDYLLRNGFAAQRVFHIGNFIDPPRAASPAARIALRAQLGIPGDALVLVTAGRFVPVKGQRFLLDAFARLPRAVGGRPLHLLMLGDGPLRVSLEAQARALGIELRVVWAGWQSDPDPYFQLADLVVFPSLEMETLGNVILEAWAHAKPLVVSLFRGAREIARHGEDAYCVPCEDAIALADGIATLLREPDLAAALARGGRARVDAEFSRQAVVRQYRDLYDRLLETR